MSNLALNIYTDEHRYNMLRPYQTDGVNAVYDAWHAGHRNVLLVFPTGAGKTVTFASIIHAHKGASCAIAHRQELVSQISIALAREGVMHRIIGPKQVISAIVQLHMEEVGRSYYDPRALCAVAGVDTLISWSKTHAKQHGQLMRWAQQVTLWVQDEAHHVLKENKWGKALELFPQAWGLGVTATPERADGKGLGRGVQDAKGRWNNDGVFDYMVTGPTMRQLINGVADNYGGTRSFLTDYRVFCPPSDFDRSAVETGADGDFIRKKLALKTKESTVLGDVVQHYLRIAPGKLGVTFVPDVETAGEMARRFNEAGVPAEVVTAKTPDRVRRDVLRRFARRELLQLVNVDLFGEGFDLPAIEVVSMARATQSYALYVQQFGRALRLMEGKQFAIIIDHVGNVIQHNLPDRARVYSLERRDRCTRKAADDVIPQRNCIKGINPATGEEMIGCFQPYEVVYPVCPYCGCKPVPAGRKAPEQVDGDLFELDADTLAAMRGEVARIDAPVEDVFRHVERTTGNYVAAKGAANRHEERQKVQRALRETMGWWMAWQQQTYGRSEAESYRRFFHAFKIDALTAQALGKQDGAELMGRIAADVVRMAESYGRNAA